MSGHEQEDDQNTADLELEPRRLQEAQESDEQPIPPLETEPLTGAVETRPLVPSWVETCDHGKGPDETCEQCESRARFLRSLMGGQVEVMPWPGGDGGGGFGGES